MYYNLQDYNFVVYSLLSDKKKAQNIWSMDLVHKEPFGYRVADHGYLLKSCPELSLVSRLV